ncbi:1-phosphatidylinositol-4-phosphate 5-kinase, partial [Tremellales sp. Uapishka_1]
MAVPSPPPQQPYDPLSAPRAAFSNHYGRSSPVGSAQGRSFLAQELVGEGSRDARAREAMRAEQDKQRGEVEDQDQDQDWRNEVMKLDTSPRINPFHLLSHPNSPSLLPPLPPHLQALASDTSEGSALPLKSSSGAYFPTTTSRGANTSEPSVHIAKVTKDTVHIIPHTASSSSTAEMKHKRIIKKVSKVFRKGPSANGNGNIEPVPPMPNSKAAMQSAPPSPPLSEVELESEGSVQSQSQSADGETTTETTPNETEYNGQEVSSRTERAGDKPLPPLSHSPSILNGTFTSEPMDLAASSPTVKAPLLYPNARRVSSSSINSRAGSLAIVRSGFAPQSKKVSGSDKPAESANGEVHDPKLDEANKGLPPPLQVGLGLDTVKDLPSLPSASNDGDRSRRGSGSSLAPVQPGSFLHPSSANTPSPPSSKIPLPRRNTNPSPINAVPSTSTPRSPLVHSHSSYGRSPSVTSQTMVPGTDGAGLDSHILAHAEILRRERLERRQRSVARVEDAEVEPKERDREEVERDERSETAHPLNPLSAAAIKPGGKGDEAKVLVGNLIGEDHVNYVLMYNMLTGIRIGVSRCQAKIKRPLTDEDYLARHKFSFDIVGNELTPSAKYDFKFKDYAPWVFRDLRDEHFHLDPADYLLSLTAKYILSELGSPGKSGSFFYFSRDYRFIIKTISHSEHKFLRSILKDYHLHVKANPHTLLSRFYGLHRVKLPRGRKIHFVIMNNLFPPHRDIHETYDLKGSAWGREYPEEKALLNPRAVLKDKNWVGRKRTLELGPEKRALFTEQLRRDMEFLKKMRVMDYSLLVGIHNMERGNRDNLRENSLTVFHPEMPVRRKPSAVKPSSDASNVRKAIRRSDPKSLDVASQLPHADSADRRHFLFYQDEGGLRATDEANQNLDQIYYLGVIDICTPYNTAKKIEHFWKSLTEDRHMISCVDPVAYGQRFLNFMMSVMRGGDITLRPSGLLPELEDARKEEVPVGEVEEMHVQEGLIPPPAAAAPAVVGHLKAE